MSTRIEHEYVGDLATTVNRMFADGIRDPRADEIAHQHFTWTNPATGDRTERVLGSEIIDGVRQRLPKIRAVLEAEYGHPVCLVSSTYYSRFRHKPIETKADARRCLPLGHAVSAQGIYLQSGVDDPIYREMLEVNGTSGAAKVRRSFDRVLDAFNVGRLTPTAAQNLFSDTQRQLAPSKPEMAARLVGVSSEQVALTEGEDTELDAQIS